MKPPPWFHTSGAHAGVPTPSVDTRQHTRAFEQGCSPQVVLTSRGVAATSHGASGRIGGGVGPCEASVLSWPGAAGALRRGLQEKQGCGGK